MKEGISIVLPFYNDQYSVKSIINKCIKFLTDNNIEFEIIAVNDGSIDNTLLELTTMQSLYPEKLFIVNIENNQGYGSAILAGINNTKFDWICQLDGDDQYEIYNLEKCLKQIASSDLIISKRTNLTYSYIRVLAHHIYCKLIKFLYKIEYNDVSAGFRLFNKSKFNFHDFVANSGFWGAELIIRANRQKLIISEIEINTLKRKYGNGSIFTFKNIKSTISDIKKLYLHLERIN